MQGFVSELASAYSTVPAGERDVADVLRRAGEPLPPLRFGCGTDDPLLQANRTLHRELTVAGVAHDYAEFPGGHMAVLRSAPRGVAVFLCRRVAPGQRPAAC